MIINEIYPKEYFIQKFGREPKSWTIDELHNLYIRVRDRSNRRWVDFKNYVYGVVLKEIPKFEGKYYIYYYQDNSIRGFEITNNHDGFRYTFSDPTFKTREDKLKFILNADPRNFKIGQEFYRLKRLHSSSSSTTWKIKSFLAEKISKKLKEVEDKSIFRDKSIAIVNISGVKYVVNIQNINYDNYFDFKWDGEILNENIIKL
jgi:hypothetical protein